MTASIAEAAGCGCSISHTTATAGSRCAGREDCGKSALGAVFPCAYRVFGDRGLVIGQTVSVKPGRIRCPAGPTVLYNPFAEVLVA
jgi:hypothetical protein